MTRRFARLRPVPLTEPGSFAVPSDGLCLSVFLVLEPPGRPGEVLAGHVAPGPRWEEVGAISGERLARTSSRWMLPSSQLLLLEGPGDAARRLLHEQLGLDDLPLGAPAVFSETYVRPGAPDGDPHWDLHFVFRGQGPTRPPVHELWRDLAYIRVADTPRSDFARNQGDILELVGLPPRG